MRLVFGCERQKKKKSERKVVVFKNSSEQMLLHVQMDEPGGRDRSDINTEALVMSIDKGAQLLLSGESFVSRVLLAFFFFFCFFFLGRAEGLFSTDGVLKVKIECARCKVGSLARA